MNSGAPKTIVVSNARKKAFAVVGLQTLVVLVFAVICGFKSLVYSRDVLLGGMANILPNLYFAYRWFACLHRREQVILKSFYRHEIVKMILSIGLMLVLLSLIKTVLPLFIGFFGAYLGLWLQPLATMFETKQ